MAKLLITTQVYENYGAHDWDGTGVCPRYWKAKGGNDYVVAGFTGDPRAAADMLRARIESDDDYFQETIIGTDVVADDYLTEFERSQLDYEGFIRFPAQQLTF